jgi:hypothetical protein
MMLPVCLFSEVLVIFPSSFLLQWYKGTTEGIMGAEKARTFRILCFLGSCCILPAEGRRSPFANLPSSVSWGQFL